jgi:protein-S-isoprenylcysteine O-methyltransferase Ste14
MEAPVVELPNDTQKEKAMEHVWDHYYQWGAVAVWVVLYAVLLLFTPFYRKSERKPAGTYLAFVVAFALEMFGVPFTMYVAGWAFGIALPEGVLWGHTLVDWIGHWGMYAGVLMMAAGIVLVVSGWRVIHRHYWQRESGAGELVQSGIYRYIRHPQYTGFFLVTLGMIAEWATLPLLVMWPILFVLYYRLAKREERDMVAEFGDAYERYRARTGMFLPRLVRRAATADAVGEPA